MTSNSQIVFRSLADKRTKLQHAIREKRLLEMRDDYDRSAPESRHLTLRVIGYTNEVEVLTRLVKRHGGAAERRRETADGGDDMERRYGTRGMMGAGVRAISLPAASADGNIFAGYAAVYESSADMGGEFVEIIRRGAFRKTLSESPDVRFLINHDGLPLARTVSGTLKLREDSTGLYAEAALDPEDPEVKSIKPKMRRGDLNQMSFGFRTIEDRWSAPKGGKHLRELLELSLHDGDVSIVTYPAYPATRAVLRQAAPPAVRRSGDERTIEWFGQSRTR